MYLQKCGCGQSSSENQMNEMRENPSHRVTSDCKLKPFIEIDISNGDADTSPKLEGPSAPPLKIVHVRKILQDFTHKFVPKRNNASEKILAVSDIQPSIQPGFNSFHHEISESYPNQPNPFKSGSTLWHTCKKHAVIPATHAGHLGAEGGANSSQRYSSDYSNSETVSEPKHSTQELERCWRFHNCCRFAYVVINNIILIFSIIGLCLVAWMLSRSSIMRLVLTAHVFCVTVTGLGLNGIQLLVTSLCGFLGLSYKKSIFLLIHVGFTMMLSAMLLTNAMLQSSYQISFEKQLRPSMKVSMRLVKDDTRMKQAWDTVQTSFSCCGIDGYRDWCEMEDEIHPEYLKRDLPDHLNDSVRLTTPAAMHYVQDRAAYNTTSTRVPPNNRSSAHMCSGMTSCCKPNLRQNDSCILTPTSAYETGCLVPMVTLISLLGKMCRIVCIALSLLVVISGVLALSMFIL